MVVMGLKKGDRVKVIGGNLSGTYGEVLLVGENSDSHGDPFFEAAVKIGDGKIYIVNTVFLHVIPEVLRSHQQ